MKAVILAGGLGTRLSEETTVKPKPMVEVGDNPILWHIMKIYASHGINDFVVCCGYKGEVIKEYFANYFLRASDVTFDLKNNKMQVHSNGAEAWKVTLVDTGQKTMTGGRLKRVRDYIDNETFCLTYGDGLSDVDITKQIEFHKQQGVAATLLAVQPEGRFGAFQLKEGESKIEHFREKPKGDGAWINGGFFVLEPSAIDYVRGDTSIWEQEPLMGLAKEGRLAAFKHYGFWHPMDTLRDKNHLGDLWDSGEAPWKVW